MSTATGRAEDETTRSCATELVCQKCDVRRPIDDTEAFCPTCGKCMDLAYDYELATARLREVPMAERPSNIWRLSELLPIRAAKAQAEVGQFSGMTPLIAANRLGAKLGLRKLYLKDDSTQRPSLSYKDRVVSTAIARALELGKQEIGCVSTGNVGTAVASLAAKAGLTPYVFYPNRLEETKARVCRALGARVCQVAGNYDEANRECRKVAAASGLEFANITLRPFYAEGAKTTIFEIVEQLGWRAPDHIVSATAGGTLSSRLHKGLVELQRVGLAQTGLTKMHIAQPEGCSPIANAIIAHEPEIQPCKPTTVAHSLAIGAPGDGYLVIDAVLSRKGSAGTASDEEIFAGIDLLAANEGILTEPAGGTTIAVLKKLAEAGELDPDATVVAIITGNGLKTLDEHPEKPWPSMVECESESMLAVLSDFQHEEARQPLPA
ncbi:MAG TPA: threonine synthase [Solirubrobacteraceae bacterium]|jgi:threonine synthase|nr:threonine synthase [Solirubrobacteraceae bacterium]